MSLRLTPQLIADLVAGRQAALAQISGQISPEFAAKIAAKLQREAHDAAMLISADKITETRLAQYSFVLDSRYFEQKFLL